MLSKELLNMLVELVIMDYFIKKESNLSLAGFSDSDWAGNVDNRKAPLVCDFM